MVDGLGEGEGGVRYLEGGETKWDSSAGSRDFRSSLTFDQLGEAADPANLWALPPWSPVRHLISTELPIPMFRPLCGHGCGHNQRRNRLDQRFSLVHGTGDTRHPQGRKV